MIIGLGIDVVDIARFEKTLERTPDLATRLFTQEERAMPLASKAARFAAKEAIAKALRAPAELAWQDVYITRPQDGPPEIVATGTVAAAAQALGGTTWHVSLTHDGAVASAVVILES